jgi:hypothetical protein
MYGVLQNIRNIFVDSILYCYYVKVGQDKVHPLCDPEYFLPCIANLTEGKSFVHMFELPIGM